MGVVIFGAEGTDSLKARHANISKHTPHYHHDMYRTAESEINVWPTFFNQSTGHSEKLQHNHIAGIQSSKHW